MAEPFFILFSLLFIGYAFGKSGWLTPAMNEGICTILVNIAMPALLISSIIELEIGGRTLGDFTLMALLSVGLFFVYARLVLPYMKLTNTPKAKRGMLQLSMLSSNNGFMGFPVTLAFFGETGLLLMVANNFVMCVIFWTFGVYVLKRSKRIGENRSNQRKTSFRDVMSQIMNPNVISIIIGMGLGFTGIDGFIPIPVKSLLAMLAALATPLSMLYIGVTLSGSDLKSLFRDRLIVSASLTRAIVFFAITAGILWFLPISALMKQICLLVVALPSASAIPAMTAIYGTGKEDATKIVVFSTLLSLLTAPLGVWIAMQLF